MLAGNGYFKLEDLVPGLRLSLLAVHEKRHGVLIGVHLDLGYRLVAVHIAPAADMHEGLL